MSNRKRVLYILLFACTLMMAGCGKDINIEDSDQLMEQNTSADSEDTDTQTNNQPQQNSSSDAIMELYQEIYEEVVGTNAIDEGQMSDVIQEIVQKLGEHRYTAIDGENQIDMTQKEQVLRFCEAVEQKEESDLAILVVAASDRFTQYELTTVDGEVAVSKMVCQYNNGRFEKVSTVSYPADSWQYTKEGYLIFTGSSYSEESYVLTMNDVPEAVALRVEPLDEQCREYNRRYIMPTGYGRNNMFLCDWSEKDYGNLDFYDVFDRFYQTVYQQTIPYVADENINIGAVYRIPEEEFESVVATHFAIDAETLHSKTKYLPEDKAYEYRPRGFYEVEYPNIPYPEVISYVANDDGTITLTVNAVYPSEGTSKAFSHEVVICPLEDGAFQYVSNTMLRSKDDFDTGWHTDRLTEDAWEEIYGKLPQPYAKYVQVLTQIMEEGTDPNGRVYSVDQNWDKFENNLFAIMDIDMDGGQELIFNFNESYMGAMCEVVYAYDEESGILREEFSEWVDNTYYSNGFVKASFSHNHGKDPDSRGTWPYALYQYDAETDSYQVQYYVDSWDKYAYSEDFPDKLDADGDGLLFYITEKEESVDDADVIWLNQEEYDRWVQETIPEQCKVDVTYHSMTEESISTNNAIKAHAICLSECKKSP